MNQQNKTYFKKPCSRCQKLFTPTGKYQKLCPDCRDQNHTSKEALKKKYFKTKEKLDTIRDNATLAKWRALSKGYKIGKKIWGSRFTRQRLAHDMEIPMTTLLRCLSLNRATPKSLKLMKEGKISASKLAMITCSKCKTFQDDIVDLVIKNDYSTHQIKSLKVNNLKDVGKEKLRLAVDKGFTRQSSAASGFQNWIEKGKLYLLLKRAALSDKKFEEIKLELKELNKRIDLYIS